MDQKTEGNPKHFVSSSEQDFEAVPYDKSSYGKFHIGDSYIVLKVRRRVKNYSEN